jgi:hypothetical protein
MRFIFRSKKLRDYFRKYNLYNFNVIKICEKYLGDTPGFLSVKLWDSIFVQKTT